MHLHAPLALAHRKMPHFLRYRHEVPDVHRLEFALVNRLAHTHKESSLQHRHVFIRGVPMRRDFRAIRAPEAYDERCAFSIRIPGNSCELATFQDRRPLQIPKVHNLMRLGAVFFVLALNSYGNYRQPDERCAHTSQTIPFHKRLLRRNETTTCSKDTLLATLGQCTS